MTVSRWKARAGSRSWSLRLLGGMIWLGSASLIGAQSLPEPSAPRSQASSHPAQSLPEPSAPRSQASSHPAQSLPEPSAPRLEALEARLHELETLLEALEKKSASDRLQFTGEFRLWHHRFQYRHDPHALDPQFVRERVVANQVHLRLNLRTEVSPHWRFTGRLAMYKNWGDNASVAMQDYSVGSLPSDSGLRVERAYLEYFLSGSWTLALGRLPTSEGPPQELAFASVVRSSYPNALYGGALDGVALRYQFPTLAEWQSGVQFLRAEIGNFDHDSLFRKQNQYSTGVSMYHWDAQSEGRHWRGQMSLSQAEIQGFFYSPPALETVRRTIEGRTGLSLEPNPPTQPVADIVIRVAHIQGEWLPARLAGYLTSVFSDLYSNGRRVTLMLEGTQTPAFCRGINQPLACDKASPPKHWPGWARNFGGTWRLPWGGILAPKLGGEAHHGSLRFFGVGGTNGWGAQGGDLSFYNVNGTATHFYYLQPLEETLWFRLGHYRAYQRIFARTILEKAPQRLEQIYLLLDARF